MDIDLNSKFLYIELTQVLFLYGGEKNLLLYD